MEMFRREINLHLTRCPASVLVCMAEWNREFLAYLLILDEVSKFIHS